MSEDEGDVVDKLHKITKALLQTGSSRHPLPKLRKKLACQFVMEYGFSLAETARQLGVSTSAVAHILERNA
jgi:hypothetical protein